MGPYLQGGLPAVRSFGPCPPQVEAASGQVLFTLSVLLREAAELFSVAGEEAAAAHPTGGGRGGDGGIAGGSWRRGLDASWRPAAGAVRKLFRRVASGGAAEAAEPSADTLAKPLTVRPQVQRILLPGPNDGGADGAALAESEWPPLVRDMLVLADMGVRTLRTDRRTCIRLDLEGGARPALEAPHLISQEWKQAPAVASSILSPLLKSSDVVVCAGVA